MYQVLPRLNLLWREVMPGFGPKRALLPKISFIVTFSWLGQRKLPFGPWISNGILERGANAGGPAVQRMGLFRKVWPQEGAIIFIEGLPARLKLIRYLLFLPCVFCKDCQVTIAFIKWTAYLGLIVLWVPTVKLLMMCPSEMPLETLNIFLNCLCLCSHTSNRHLCHSGQFEN